VACLQLVRVNVDELVVVCQVSELVDLVLTDLEPIAGLLSDTNLFPHDLQSCRRVAHFSVSTPVQFEEPDWFFDSLEFPFA